MSAPNSTEAENKKSINVNLPTSPESQSESGAQVKPLATEPLLESIPEQTSGPIQQQANATPTTSQELISNLETSTPAVATITSPEQKPIQIPPTPVTTNLEPKQELQSQPITPQKAIVTKVKLSDELNIFDWFRSTDIINQIAEKAKNSVDSVITVLDPGMKEYLYSGGNINIIVISDSERLVSPIRDAFQTVFGRATVVAARYNPPEAATDYPVRLACGFDEALAVAKERIKRLRHDTSNVPQNQVVVVIQPTIITIIKNETASSGMNQGLNVDENLLPKWFLSYCMVIEDPVLGTTMNSYSQFIPIDSEVVTAAREVKFPDDFPGSHLGFAISIGELMIPKLNLKSDDDSENPESGWIYVWSGLDEIKLINDLSISLAHLYRRKWNSCIG